MGNGVLIVFLCCSSLIVKGVVYVLASEALTDSK